VVLLTTTGAKTGQQRTLPVIAVPDGDNLVVIASNRGQRQHPAWYYNLPAHPEGTVTVGGASWRVQAREATGEGGSACGGGTWRSIRSGPPVSGTPRIGASRWWCWLR